MGPRDARRLDDRGLDRWLEPLSRERAPATTPRPARSGGRSASPRTCCRPTSTRSRRTSRRCSRRAARSASRPRPRPGRAVLHPPLGPVIPVARLAAGVGVRLDAMAGGRAAARASAPTTASAGDRSSGRSRLARGSLAVWRPVLPESFRQMPRARAADRGLRPDRPSPRTWRSSDSERRAKSPAFRPTLRIGIRNWRRGRDGSDFQRRAISEDSSARRPQ